MIYSPGRRAYVYAVLCDHYKLRLDEIRRLTPYQISRVYFHPRDKDGALVAPTRLSAIEQLAQTEAGAKIPREVLQLLLVEELYKAGRVTKEQFDDFKSRLANRPAGTDQRHSGSVVPGRESGGAGA